MRFFSDALLLKTLCAPEALQDLETILDYLGIYERQGREYDRVVDGYKLVVATSLYSVIDRVINFSSLVGLEVDHRLVEWWGWRENSEGVPERSAFTYPESDLADLVVSLQDLVIQFPRSRTWESFEEAIGKAHTLGETLYESALGSSVYWLRGQTEELDTVEALRRGAIERVDDYLEDHTMMSAYDFTWGYESRKETVLPEIMDDFWRETESHLDSPPLSFPQQSKGPNWGKGILAALSIALSRLGFEGRTAAAASALFLMFTDSPAQVKDNLHSSLNHNWPSMQYGLDQPAGVPLDHLIEEKGHMENIHAENRLRDLVGKEEGRILGRGSYDALDFPMILEAAASGATDDNRVEVVRVEHPALHPGYLTRYSIAIRTPRFGFVSNVSKWWVFYKAYGFGQLADPENHHAERLAKESLAKYADRINLIELEPVGDRFFLSLFEPSVWRTVFNEAKHLNDVNAELRGVIPELLVTDLLARQDYGVIRTSFKPHALGGLEFDSLGIKAGPNGSDCLVVEVKGGSSTDKVLERDLDRFASKVRMLKEHLPELAEQFGYTDEITSVSGTFISMGRPRLEYDAPDVTFLDYDGFVRELRRAGVPSRLFDQLHPIRVSIIHSPDDAWFRAINEDEAPYASESEEEE